MNSRKLGVWRHCNGTHTARDSHLVGFVHVLLPCALACFELAAAVATEAAVAVLPNVTRCGSVKFGQKLTSLAVYEPSRALALERHGICLEEHQTSIALQDNLEFPFEDIRPLSGD